MEEVLEDSPEINRIQNSIEACIQNTPVVVLGSGASAAHGIHTMDSLCETIIDEIESRELEESEQEDWLAFKIALSETANLERSLEKIEANKVLSSKITSITWNQIASRDQEVFLRLLTGEESLPLSTLIKRLSNGLGNAPHVKIVTTNYDRLAEYACDFIDDKFNEYLHYSGFSYGFIRRPDDNFILANQNADRRTLRKRTEGFSYCINPVEILKVHGSIDWFEGASGEIYSLPNLNLKDESMLPAIIIPGKGKFERTHSQPFSTIITRAREILYQSSSYFVVGFGFRDDHVHNNLTKKIRNDRRHNNFVVLAKELTEETKGLFFDGNYSGNFVLVEQDTNGAGSVIHYKDLNSSMESYVLYGKDLWSLSEFNRFFLKER